MITSPGWSSIRELYLAGRLGEGEGLTPSNITASQVLLFETVRIAIRIERRA